MKRWLAVFLAASLAIAAIAFVAFPRKVQVTSGTRYVCTYGESLGSDVHTLEVPQGDAGKYTIATKTITCARHRQAEQLYLKAQQEIQSGDLKSALKDLKAVVALDAAFRQAPSQISLINGGKKPKADTGAPQPSADTTKTSGGGGDIPSTSPAMDTYRNLLPDRLPGFTAEALNAEPLTLGRDYVPSNAGRYDQLVIMVQQCGSVARSQATVKGQLKSAYPEGKNVTVSGLAGWFGTNGTGFAALSLVKGEIVITFELHATGAKPASLESDLRSIAEGVLR
ncbi:MAG TPA: hypothetical protein VGK50_00220 [Coriobacteriia bacterium]|jgi:hypothetical protein